MIKQCRYTTHISVDKNKPEACSAGRVLTGKPVRLEIPAKEGDDVSTPLALPNAFRDRSLRLVARAARVLDSMPQEVTIFLATCPMQFPFPCKCASRGHYVPNRMAHEV